MTERLHFNFKIKSVTVSTLSLSISDEVMGLVAMIFSFLNVEP